MLRRSLSLLGDGLGTIRRLVALPDCESVRVGDVTLRTASGDIHASADDAAAIAEIERVGRIREQTVALVSLEPGAIARVFGPSNAAATLDIEIVIEGARGPLAKDTGPFSHACSRSILNYEPEDAAAWRPPSPSREEVRGTVTYCTSVTECAARGNAMSSSSPRPASRAPPP